MARDYDGDGDVDKKDKKLAKKDLNDDGVVDDSERQAWKDRKGKGKGDGSDDDSDPEKKRDKLEADLMASEFRWAWKIIKEIPELKGIWEKALDKGWDIARFQVALMDSDWFKENNGYRRTIQALKLSDPATYESRVQAAMDKIKDDMNAMGLKAPFKEGGAEKLRAWAEQYLMLGFDMDSRLGSSYNDWLADRFVKSRQQGAELGGEALTTQEELAGLLISNGFNADAKHWKRWMNKTINEIAMKNMTKEEAAIFIREQAASAYPVFSERIRAGANVEDIAAAYMELYADTLEVNPAQVSLRDKYMREALQGVDPETGKPRAMGLWEFQKLLRKDERWQYTKQANSMADSVASEILSMFGFVGS